MKCVYRPANEGYYGAKFAKLEFKDDYGNEGTVNLPHERERGFGQINLASEWYDAKVEVGYVDGGADEVGAIAEFALHLAHVAKTLDLAFAEDKAVVVEELERFQRYRELKDARRKVALRYRCEDLAQYYMQMVRVQREGHSSNAKGELMVVTLGEGTDEARIRSTMYVKESNGNRWQFEADKVAKFEVKDGNRYREVELTPMAQLERDAMNEVAEEVAT